MPAPKTTIHKVLINIGCISENAFFMQFLCNFMLPYQIYLQLYNQPELFQELIGELPVVTITITSYLQNFILVRQVL